MIKAGVNLADEREWGRAGPYHPFSGRPEEWPAWVARLIDLCGVTDLVLYGDTRPVHAAARKAARERGVAVHCFEEGYLRPYWVTYERDASNGASRLMKLSAMQMAAASRIADFEIEPAPAYWGTAWRHAFCGFRYHWRLLFRSPAYPHFRPHRPTGPWTELGHYLRRLLVLPALAPQRRWRKRRLERSGRRYHLVLLQMAVDASMREHGRFATVADFIEYCLKAFAEGAEADETLVFKTHPFEDGREHLERKTRILARRLGIGERVEFLQGGRLGPLLDGARTAITINSTAGQQALWRGMPLFVAGRAVYDKPEFTPTTDLAEFFRRPQAPDLQLYYEYRRFLLMSSQVRGSYYSAAGRRSLAPLCVEKMLDPLCPYERVFAAAREANLLFLHPLEEEIPAPGAARSSIGAA